MEFKSLGDRMKNYEHSFRFYLQRRTPTIIRIDGNCFHTWTKGLENPYDVRLKQAFEHTASYLLSNIQGAVLAYCQSDEISLLLTDYKNIKSDAWFGKNVQKMASVSASMATAKFNDVFSNYFPDTEQSNKFAHFDSRVFTLPKEEVVNYFIYRQQDTTRNSIQSLARANFSHKQCHNKSCSELQDMLMTKKAINWNAEISWFKRGFCVSNDALGVVVQNTIPIFTQDRAYVNKFVYLEGSNELA